MLQDNCAKFHMFLTNETGENCKNVKQTVKIYQLLRSKGRKCFSTVIQCSVKRYARFPNFDGQAY